MQRQRSSVSTLPENLSFDHSTSSDTAVDSQMSWDNVHTSAPNLLPEYMISLNEPNILDLHHVMHEGHNVEWNTCQTNSSDSDNLADQNEGKMEHTRDLHTRAVLNLEVHQPSNASSSEIVVINPNGNHTPNEPFLLHNSSSGTLSQDLNICSVYQDHEDDECHIVERPNTYISIGPLNEQRISAGSPSDSLMLPFGFGGYVMRENETAASLDGRRVSCKRKAFEVGQSSEAGSSNYQQHVVRSHLHAVPAAQISASNSGISTQAYNNHIVGNGSEQSNPRFRLGVGESVPASPFSLTASGTPENSHRSFHLRIDGSHQQDSVPLNTFSTAADVGNVDAPSRRASRLVMRNRSLNLNPAPETGDGSVHGPSVLMHVPSVRPYPQSRWNGASNSRTSRSSASSSSGGRDAIIYEDPMQRTVLRNISEHPMFVPASERSSSQHPTNWNFAGGSSNIAGIGSSSSLVGSSSGVNSSSPSWAHHSYPQYSRRLSEIARRSQRSLAGMESGGQSSNNSVRSGSSATPQVNFTGSVNHGHRASNSRSALLERHRNGALALPYSLQTLASATEERRSIMSEIRRVLDLMRRGEGLRLEDVMILDHSVFFGMADIHDQHRDMRLDVDNMSYEELLALEEHIGNVCTGLNEETITKHMKTHKHVDSEVDNPLETEPCIICREEYAGGEDLGTLECGHDFHKDCIKQWLTQKNLCPICKTTGLTT